MGNKEKPKIKILMIANKLDVTGISTVIMNYCSHMNLDCFEIEIAAGEPIAEIHRDDCKKLGIKLYELPNRKQNSSGYYRELNKIVRRDHPDVLHVHGNSATMAVELFIGWLHGVRIRIPHSHNTTCMSMKLHKLLLPIFNHLYTQGFACGQKAGEWLYKDKKFFVIPNGFDTKKFKFDGIARKKIRTELGLEKAFVVGHIGRFNEQKNQPFLISVFERLASKRTDAILLLVGIGPDFEKTKALVAQSPYKERIILYGETNAPQELYSVMDVFVLPSRYEGLPVVLIEAQCSGLYCIISDRVTDEMNISGHIIPCSLEESPSKWCELIESVPTIDRSEFYNDNSNAIHAYDIELAAEKLEKLYAGFLDSKK